ncbi:hypothetical protein GDO86_006674 [Hymenochirus boettgeri]|uniref:Uncharacterized protein n=1 Tax=Hymenochirus boettgeri TaxID=247094 RepID=A0A8T2JEK8_9PIPI|nr:hypothetical protein GDO86_006674 [Hymenochirus boettgeri]
MHFANRFTLPPKKNKESKYLGTIPSIQSNATLQTERHLHHRDFRNAKKYIFHSADINQWNIKLVRGFVWGFYLNIWGFVLCAGKCAFYRNKKK